MTKKETVNAVRCFVVSTIRNRRLEASQIDQRKLVEQIESDIEQYIQQFSYKLTEVDNENE